MVTSIDPTRKSRLFVVGGAPRAGKSLMTKRLWSDFGIPSFSMDTIVASFIRIAPKATAIDWGESEARTAQIPIAARVAAGSGLITHGRFVLEGESLNPSVVTRLCDEFDIAACFMVLLDPKLDQLLEFEIAQPWGGETRRRRSRAGRGEHPRALTMARRRM